MAIAKSVNGKKDDSGKAKWDLVPFAQLGHIVNVLTFGAKKYSDDDWKRVTNPHGRFFSSAVRHIVSWRSGEIVDAESGLPHLAHAACCLLFLMWFDDSDIGAY